MIMDDGDDDNKRFAGCLLEKEIVSHVDNSSNSQIVIACLDQDI